MTDSHKAVSHHWTYCFNILNWDPVMHAHILCCTVSIQFGRGNTCEEAPIQYVGKICWIVRDGAFKSVKWYSTHCLFYLLETLIQVGTRTQRTAKNPSSAKTLIIIWQWIGVFRIPSRCVDSPRDSWCLGFTSKLSFVFDSQQLSCLELNVTWFKVSVKCWDYFVQLRFHKIWF